MKKVSYKMSPAVIFGAALAVVLMMGATSLFSQVPLLDPNTIPKWTDEMYVPPLMNPALETNIHIGMYPIEQYYHSSFPVKTKMWGYGTTKETAHSPANTIAAVRGVPITVNWTNNLVDDAGNYLVHPIDIDQTIPWADPLGTGPVMTRYNGPVPTVVHLHGGEVKSESDGHYSAWFTPDCNNAPTIHGPSYDCVGQSYLYENEQPSALIWYHDHAFGIDRINVMMGLFGGYAIINPSVYPETNLPIADAYDVPIIIQDRMIDQNYQIAYQGSITNPLIHPIWFPEFFGNIIVVNGTIWPVKTVEARKYRLRFLNGSNARFYHLYFSDGTAVDQNNNTVALDDPTFDHFVGNGMPFLHIATDGGFMKNAVQTTSFVQAPAERIEVIVDFTGHEGQDIYLVNDAVAPYPSGDPVNVNTAQILKFHVIAKASNDDAMDIFQDGTSLRPTFQNLSNPTVVHNVVLFEKEGPGGPLAMFLDGVDMSDPRSIYRPVIGTTEQWNIINTTMDFHPMHWHLTQLQIINRQQFRNYMPDGMTQDPDGYLAAYKTANPILPIPYDAPINPVDVTPFLIDNSGPTPAPFPIMNPDPEEVDAFKDTWKCPPSTVSRFITRWTQDDGSDYHFDPSQGPGYVWHCHILEHEENSMMREIHLQRATPELPTTGMVLRLDGQNYQAYGPVNYTNMMPKLNHWDDISGLGNNAVQPDANMQPMHDGYALYCKQGAMFMDNPVYGQADAFYIPYNPVISSTNPDPLNPVPENKSLFVVFKPTMMSMMGRHTIFEAGKSTSGFNIYMDNGNLLFGMWNRLERRFVKFSTPLMAGQVYLAQLEYDAAKKTFRASVNGNNSALISLKGLSQDNSPTGIGAEVGGTRYHDYAISNSYANNYDGDIGDVLLYNTYDPVVSQGVVNFLKHRYNQPWTYTSDPLLKEGWIVYEQNEDPGENKLVAAYPNPFNEKADFSLNLDSKQYVNIDLYNSLGEKALTIYNGSLDKGSNNFTIDGASLNPGMYMIKATGDGFTETSKVVFFK